MIQDKRILIGKPPITEEKMEHIRRQCIYSGVRVVHFDVDCNEPYIVVEKTKPTVKRPKKRFIQ